jgi:pSer/pThr/pTyr-binding forkhead associated (FHA) protein
MAKSKLICTLDNRVLGEHLLDKERITIGRRQNNDIVIDNLSVSGLHATIVTIGKDAFLEDANSTNGTLVNLKPVRKHLLNEDDVIEIGRHQFRYIKGSNHANSNKTPTKPAADEAGSTALGKTPNTKPPSLQSIIQQSRNMPLNDAQQLSETAPTAIKVASIPLAKLLFLSGTNHGKTISLSKTLTTLGKKGGQVVVITKRANGYFLSLVEGEVPPTLNDSPFHARSYQLKHNDTIEVSGVKMEFLNSQ